MCVGVGWMIWYDVWNGMGGGVYLRKVEEEENWDLEVARLTRLEARPPAPATKDCQLLTRASACAWAASRLAFFFSLRIFLFFSSCTRGGSVGRISRSRGMVNSAPGNVVDGRDGRVAVAEVAEEEVVEVEEEVVEVEEVAEAVVEVEDEERVGWEGSFCMASSFRFFLALFASFSRRAAFASISSASVSPTVRTSEGGRKPFSEPYPG